MALQIPLIMVDRHGTLANRRANHGRVSFRAATAVTTSKQPTTTEGGNNYAPAERLTPKGQRQSCGR